MPGPKPCPPDCDCWHHRNNRTPEEIRQQKTEYMRRWRAANPDRDRANWQRLRTNPQVRAKTRQSDRDNWQVKRIRRHGLTPEQFARMVEQQNGRCYLCLKPLDLESQRKTHIDHDHSCCAGASSCGECVRGITHAGCNHAIGQFGDSPERMEQAAAALRAANARVAARLTNRAEIQAELPLNVVRLHRSTGGAA